MTGTAFVEGGQSVPCLFDVEDRAAFSPNFRGHCMCFIFPLPLPWYPTRMVESALLTSGKDCPGCGTSSESTWTVLSKVKQWLPWKVYALGEGKQVRVQLSPVQTYC